MGVNLVLEELEIMEKCILELLLWTLEDMDKLVMDNKQLMANKEHMDKLDTDNKQHMDNKGMDNKQHMVNKLVMVNKQLMDNNLDTVNKELMDNKLGMVNKVDMDNKLGMVNKEHMVNKVDIVKDNQVMQLEQKVSSISQEIIVILLTLLISGNSPKCTI